MQSERIKAVVDEAVKGHDGETSIVAMLQDIQGELHYLPKEGLEYLSSKTGVSIAKIYGVATFYENFSLEPKGKYVIKICDGTACHVRKSLPILNRIRENLGLSEEKKTTDDELYTVETVSCLGACGLAPVLMVNEDVHPAMTPEKADELLKELGEEAAK